MSTGLAPALTGYRPIEGSFAAYKREQSRIARRRLYPLTAFYTTYSLIVALLGLRTAHPWIGMAFYLAGIPVWSLVEYLFHRYVLHGRFPTGKGLIRRFLHERLDPLHWEHHERPFDGWHISGGSLRWPRPSAFSFPCTLSRPYLPVLCKAMSVKSGSTISCISENLAFASSRISSDIICTITARAEWKWGMGSPVESGTLYSTRSTQSRFASHSSKTAVTAFALGK